MRRGRYWIGFDVGQAQDYSALSLLQKIDDRYYVTALDRLPLNMSYPEQVDLVHTRMNLRPLARATKTLCIDATGVGRPIVDLAEDKGLNPIAITITGGNDANWDNERRKATVPKRDLANTLRIFAETDRLRALKDFKQILVEELPYFIPKIDPRTGHDSYEARQEGRHDDLILSVAIALWVAENQEPRSKEIIFRGISSGGRHGSF